MKSAPSAPVARPERPARRELFGTAFDNLTRAEAADAVEQLIAARNGCRVVCVKDVALTVRARDDAQLRRFYERVDYLFVDGRGIYYASHWLRQPLVEMVGGPGLYYEMLRRAERAGYRVYFVGASQDVLSRAVARVRERHPSLHFVGSTNGYFDDDGIPRVLAGIADAAPDLVFVGIATPKRERFIERLRAAGQSCVCIAIGGVLDVEAGDKRLAPAFIGRLGFEWAYRALQEPRRLLPRYLRTHSRFALLLLREAIQARRQARAVARRQEGETALRNRS